MDTPENVTRIITEWHEGAPTAKQVQQGIRALSKETGTSWSKSRLLAEYKKILSLEKASPNPVVLAVLRRKPIRTLSGVAPVTVLTKPFPCPGQCIFCPNDIRMPKSYLADEPGAQRAERNWFDPYLQTYNRLDALDSIGHDVDKVEIIVLGGTWSFYPIGYQRWFISEVFRALNDFAAKKDLRPERERVYAAAVEPLAHQGKPELTNNPLSNEEALKTLEIHGTAMNVGEYNRVIETTYSGPERRVGFDKWQQAEWTDVVEQQLTNETAAVKCVGLVLETRPDSISLKEVINLRRLGATKVQIGIQSLQDDVLKKNRRGHTVAATERAFALLRLAGFKIHGHWMANLHGSDPQKDVTDYQQLFSPAFCPDELKIYPCSLIDSAELMQYYQRGEWQAYTQEELAWVIGQALLSTPAYCRLTRIIRDIPSQYIVTGNTKTNFRQVAEQKLEDQQTDLQDIRSREIRGTQFDESALRLVERTYETTVSHEVFLEWNVPSEHHAIGQIVAFLRLSLPKQQSEIKELHNSAVIREVHVYGQLTKLGRTGKTQHAGLGARLLQRACEISTQAGFTTIAVISAIGTKEYYRKQGFSDGELYQHRSLL